MTQIDTSAAPEGFAIDPRWQAVADETLRRPPVPIAAPGRCAHLVFMTRPEVADAQRDHVLALLKGWSADIQLERIDQIIAATATFTMKWERHTEFCSLTIFDHENASTSWPPFDREWASACPGELLVAVKIAVAPGGEAEAGPGSAALGPYSARAVSMVNGGTAQLEASYQRHDDGYIHMRVTTDEPLAERVGRLVQRLIEVETYRELTLCAWPATQALGPRLNDIDAGLASLTDRLGNRNGQGGEEEKVILGQLTDLASDLEQITAQTHFRLNASLAYSDLVERRLEEIREERVEGGQRLSSLISRRLRPAARTYRSILRRQAEMSERISRTSDLLRSRIDVELAQQNQRLLASMDQRADRQLRLQQTVEGLSVVAISYYAIGILGYLLAPVAEVWTGMDTRLLTGLAAPIVVVAVFIAIRRIRHALVKPEGRK